MIFDEAHYILDDADFNKGINFFVNTFMLQSAFPNATKIFMSGSMEEFYAFLQTLQPFTIEPNDIYKEKELLDVRGDEASYTVTRFLMSAVNGCHVLSMPTDYSYIIPYKYKELKDICSQIAQTAIDEKWLIFVKSTKEGERLLSSLQSVCGGSVYYLDADNKTSNENIEIYNQLVHNSKFNCRVLIATTVIYNGINIKDSAVKHIVVPFTTVSVVKQLIGRKRMETGGELNVYFPDVTYKKIKQRYQKLIGEYLELMALKKDLPTYSLIQLNNLSNSKPSKYYYLTSQYVNSENGTILMLLPILNITSIHKLYYDTCFYIFALHRMNPELKDKVSDFTAILLTHLGIADKCADVINITVKTQEEKRDSVQFELAEYLEQLVGAPIIVPDEKGSYDALLDLKKAINDAHKALYEGKNFDSQWKNKDRFFSEEKVKALLSELTLPYRIKSEATKEHRTITVTKQE